MRASKQFTYSVLKSFRFASRDYSAGMEFNARRVDPQDRQLQRWVDEGYLALPGSEPEEPIEEELSEEKLVALKSLVDAQPKPEAELEQLPSADEDYEE